MTNKYNNVIYAGTTSNLIKRVFEHKNKLADSFTKKYNVDKLVYYEQFIDPIEVITREKQIKAGSRKKKLDLIFNNNPKFKDLYEEVVD